MAKISPGKNFQLYGVICYPTGSMLGCDKYPEFEKTRKCRRHDIFGKIIIKFTNICGEWDLKHSRIKVDDIGRSLLCVEMSIQSLHVWKKVVSGCKPLYGDMVPEVST